MCFQSLRPRPTRPRPVKASLKLLNRYRPIPTHYLFRQTKHSTGESCGDRPTCTFTTLSIHKQIRHRQPADNNKERQVVEAPRDA